MTEPDETIRVLIPLKVRKKNGRPKIMPPADYRPSEDQAQDPHILRAIGRAWGWRRRMEAGEFATIQELAEAVGLAERHVSRQLRLAYLAPEVLKRLTCGREALGVSLYDLCFLAGEVWGEQVERAIGDCAAKSTWATLSSSSGRCSKAKRSCQSGHLWMAQHDPDSNSPDPG